MIVQTPENHSPDAPRDRADDVLVTEAVRLYGRYAVEVVERFELCPWAARARREGAVRPLVLLHDSPDDLAPSLNAIDILAGLSDITIGILIYPNLALNRLDFEHFLRKLRRADSERQGPSEVPFAMAAFHPEAKADLKDADRLIPFIRRTPDPTLQLVRSTALNAVSATPSSGTAFADLRMMAHVSPKQDPGPSVRERIGTWNLQTVRHVGAEALEAVFNDIGQDRTETYSRVRAEPPRSG